MNMFQEAFERLNQNQYIQASSRIINWLEESKTNSENIINNLPDIFAVIDERGTIYRGNRILARHLNVGVDCLLGLKLTNAFRPETWSVFRERLAALHAPTRGTEPVEFELTVDGWCKSDVLYLWSVDIFENPSDRSKRLYSVFARDITKVKDYERRLSQVFSSIPLGILQVDSEMLIIEPQSAYAEYLLGQDNLLGKPLFDVLFKPAWDGLNEAEREKVNYLLNIIGFSDIQFDLVKDELIRKIHYPLPISRVKAGEDRVRVLELAFEPIVYDQIVRSLLVIIEDRTEIERANMERNFVQRFDDAIAQRFTELRKLDRGLRNNAIRDLHVLFQNLEVASKGEDILPIMRSLHGIKGAARISGLTRLKELAHLTEDSFLSLSKSTGGEDACQKHSNKLTPVFDEWNEVYRTARAIRVMDEDEVEDSERTIRTIPFRSLRAYLTRTVQQTAASLGKQVKFAFDCDDFYIPSSKEPTLNECLIHLLNNAVDHGIEPPQVRTGLGKDGMGLVRVSAQAVDARHVRLCVEDDGFGLDLGRIRETAEARGFGSRERLKGLPPKELFMFLFEPGFTTSTVATEVSGRGVGLDAVREALLRLAGTIHVEPRDGFGTRFVIELDMSNWDFPNTETT